MTSLITPPIWPDFHGPDPFSRTERYTSDLTLCLYVIVWLLFSWVVLSLSLYIFKSMCSIHMYCTQHVPIHLSCIPSNLSSLSNIYLSVSLPISLITHKCTYSSMYRITYLPTYLYKHVSAYLRTYVNLTSRSLSPSTVHHQRDPQPAQRVWGQWELQVHEDSHSRPLEPEPCFILPSSHPIYRWVQQPPLPTLFDVQYYKGANSLLLFLPYLLMDYIFMCRLTLRIRVLPRSKFFIVHLFAK